MNRYAPSFSPEIEYLYNNSGSAVSQGCLVSYSGTVSNVEDPIPEPALGKKNMLSNQATRATAVTRPVMGIALYGGTTANAPVAVALEDIANGSWGYVACAGICDVRVGISSNITAGDYLIGTAGGTLLEDTTSVTATTIIHARALEATITSGTCVAALISAQLNGNGFGIGAMGKRA